MGQVTGTGTKAPSNAKVGIGLEMMADGLAEWWLSILGKEKVGGMIFLTGSQPWFSCSFSQTAPIIGGLLGRTWKGPKLQVRIKPKI